MTKKDPYAALRFKEFNTFLVLRFALVFAWSMQFIVIEWQVYSITKDPLSLGIIGLMEIVPALSMVRLKETVFNKYPSFLIVIS